MQASCTIASIRPTRAVGRNAAGLLSVNLYARRIATVEPVFANLRHNKRLDGFTRRLRSKVNARWHLYRLVHNIEKLAHHGYVK